MSFHSAQVFVTCRLRLMRSSADRNLFWLKLKLGTKQLTIIWLAPNLKNTQLSQFTTQGIPIYIGYDSRIVNYVFPM